MGDLVAGHANVWHAMPFVMLIPLAGLVAINQELYEAAKIDERILAPLPRHSAWPLLRGPSSSSFCCV